MKKLMKLLNDTICVQNNTHYQSILAELKQTQITAKYLYQRCKRLEKELAKELKNK
tara:strand:+ start:119 stop:286 length:168 start_codon:yes stop_codon:yes gene_type:complete